MTRGHLRLVSLTKRFGEVQAVRDVSLDVPAGSILSLLGPSGCGKTTLLRMVAGFLEPTVGSIVIDDGDVTSVAPNQRLLGMVFQNYALFPHMTAQENVEFGLRMRGMSQSDRRSRASDALTMVKMATMAKRYPFELSGGQQQRVSLARAFVTKPRILLLDEPFGALDRLMRENMQIELKSLQRELGITFLFVTHDQEEALTLSDQVAVMRDGAIEQIDNPRALFEKPKTLFVAEFFGELNTFPVTNVAVDGAHARVESPYGHWRVPLRSGTASRNVVAVRAQDVHVERHTSSPDDWISIPCRVHDVIYRGKSVLYRVLVGEKDMVLAAGGLDDEQEIAPGRQAIISWNPERCALFPLIRDD